MFSFKCVIVGDKGVGKTSLIRRLYNGEFNNEYLPTIGHELIPLTFNTTYGKIIFDVYDISDQTRINDVNCAIIMFNPNSIDTISEYYMNIKRMYPTIPIVLCANRYNGKSPKIKDYIMFDINPKLNYNIDKPFIWFARKLLDKEDLHFIDEI